jgi:O-antigen/teichoic acid export membrane protein
VDEPRAPSPDEVKGVANGTLAPGSLFNRAGHLSQLATAMVLYAIGAILAYATRSLLARTLGPSGYGQISLVLGIATLAAGLGSLGMPVALTRFLAFHRDREGTTRLVALALAGISVGTLLAGFLAAVLGVHLLPAVAPLLAGWVGVGLIVGLALATGLGDGALGASRGLGWVGRPLLIRDVAQRGLVLAGAGAVALYGLGAHGAVVAYMIGAAVYAAGGIAIVGGHLVKTTQPIAWAGWRDDLSKLFRFAWPLIGSFICLQVVNQADNLFIAAYRTIYAVGLYNAAFPLAQIIWLGTDTVVFVAGPRLARAAGSGSTRELRDQYSTLLLTAIGVSVFLAAPLIAAPTAAIDVVFGPAYSSAAKALVILAIGACAYSVGGVSGSGLIAQGRTIRYFASDAVGMVVNLFLHWTLVPRFGIEGAAVAVASALAVAAAVRIASLGPARGRPRQIAKQVLVPSIAIVGMSALVCLLVLRLPLSSELQLVAMYGILAATVLPLILRTLRRAE